VIISQPRVTTTDDEVRVEAAFELAQPAEGRSRSLWFAFPRACEEFVSDRADGFAASLLPLAMRLGEPLQVEGAVSCRLAFGMGEYQRMQVAWKPDFFKQVEARYGRLAGADQGGTAGAVGLAFSGGVDSFHTLWVHLPENEPLPPFRITHCVMINGFDEDADLEDTGAFRRIQAVYEPLMARHGLELIVVRTNLLEVLGQVLRSQSFDAFLTAPALVLGRLFSHFYLSSGWKFTTEGLYPDGAHPMLDHLLATETLETHHEGAHLTRIEKTLALSRWAETFDRLRVCYHPTGVQGCRSAIANCCACEKCLRTMMTLDIAGALPSYGCFPRPLDRRSIRDIDFRYAPARMLADEIVAYAKREGRRDIVRDIERAVFNSTVSRPRVRSLVRASMRLQRRSPLYRTLVTPPKRLARRLGWGEGWLY
jgi:hypothetical protein